MLETIEKETFYLPEDLAAKLKISLSSVYKLIRNGEIPHIRIGKVYRIPATDFQKYLNAQFRGVMAEAGPKVPETARKFVDLLKSSPAAKNVMEVWLFGSYARGDFDADSDVDLAVIVAERDIKGSEAIASLAEEAMEAANFEELLSIHEMDEKEWLSMKEDRYLIAQTITAEGILLWKRR